MAQLQEIHATGLPAVVRELGRLHEAALRTDGADALPVRLSVLTMVAVCTDEASAATAAQSVADLAQDHPARALIVIADPGAAESSIEADLSLHPTQHGASTEQVRLVVRGEAAYHMVSVVTPLLMPDVPVYVWMVGGPPLRQAFAPAALALCDHLIIDSDAYTDARATITELHGRLLSALNLRIADIAWARGRMWRDEIAHCFDAPDVRPYVHNLSAVAIDVADKSGDASSWLVAGWLAERLGMTETAPVPTIHVVPGDGDDPGSLIAVRLTATVDGVDATVTVERDGDVLTSQVAIGSELRMKRTSAITEDSTVHLVSDLMEEGVEDPLYRAAVIAAAAVMGRA